MTQWEVWRQDDNGNQYKISVSDDRIEALAQALVFEACGHKQTYWVNGPADHVCRNSHDLYLLLIAAGDRMNRDGRALPQFLRAWLKMGALLSSRNQLDLDTVAATVTAAETAEPLPMKPSWRTTAYPAITKPQSYHDWQQVLTCQVADLADLADLADFDDQGPPSGYAYYGLPAPRSQGCQRATPETWYNFDPRTYLECSVAGAFPGSDQPGSAEEITLTWGDLTHMALCGQIYE